VASQTGAVVWDQTLEGQPPRSIGSTGPIRSVAFTEDDHLVTLGADGRLHELILGDVELRQNALTRLTRGFKGEECEIPGSCSRFEQSVEHLANAQRLSRAGELERAIGEFKSAKDLSGEQEWDFSDEARLIRSSSLLNKARFELGQQNLLETVRLVKAAQAVHSIGERQLGWFTSHLVEMGQRVARRAGFQPEFNVRKEEVGLAAQAYSAAGELDPSIFSRSNSEAVSELNNLCWFGTVAGLASDVMRFCDEAIAVSARNNGPALDTHGVARACIGDVEAAKADFTDFVRLIGDEKLRKERLSWIELVEAKKLCTDQFLLEQRGSY
jgi:tetratricopeptide (TPR) repeat protein